MDQSSKVRVEARVQETRAQAAAVVERFSSRLNPILLDDVTTDACSIRRSNAIEEMMMNVLATAAATLMIFLCFPNLNAHAALITWENWTLGSPTNSSSAHGTGNGNSTPHFLRSASTAIYGGATPFGVEFGNNLITLNSFFTVTGSAAELGQSVTGHLVGRLQGTLAADGFSFGSATGTYNAAVEATVNAGFASWSPTLTHSLAGTFVGIDATTMDFRELFDVPGILTVGTRYPFSMTLSTHADKVGLVDAFSDFLSGGGWLFGNVKLDPIALPAVPLRFPTKGGPKIHPGIGRWKFDPPTGVSFDSTVGCLSLFDDSCDPEFSSDPLIGAILHVGGFTSNGPMGNGFLFTGGEVSIVQGADTLFVATIPELFISDDYLSQPDGLNVFGPLDIDYLETGISPFLRKYAEFLTAGSFLPSLFASTAGPVVDMIRDGRPFSVDGRSFSIGAFAIAEPSVPLLFGAGALLILINRSRQRKVATVQW